LDSGKKNMEAPKLENYQTLIELAKQEDLGSGDVTSEVTIGADQAGCGKLVFREDGVLCGMPVVGEVLRHYNEQLALHDALSDGTDIQAGTVIGIIQGPLRPLLAAERVVLNFLQHLSGIATQTARYVEAVKVTHARIYDTRKTTPGWRELEKYAVRCGGGCNHRQGLYDAVLIKDNHLANLGQGNLKERLEKAIAQIQQHPRQPDFVQVEVDTREQLEEVLQVRGVDMVLLDNMLPAKLSEAVLLRDRICTGRDVELEASGRITLETVREVAQTGVDRISIGALTHSVKSLDIGLDVE
jgi:nicotinate-nucleotide pyrophosphorylase (carboxylating)